jgi:hypothetical protein
MGPRFVGSADAALKREASLMVIVVIVVIVLKKRIVITVPLPALERRGFLSA